MIVFLRTIYFSDTVRSLSSFDRFQIRSNSAFAMLSQLVCLTYFLLSVVVSSSGHEEANIIAGKSYINAINSVTTTWKAGENFAPNTPLKHILGLLGSKGVRTAKDSFENRTVQFTGADVPNEFDARENWKMCKTIGTVRDQGNCGCCWAFSTTGAFADRLCIATNGKFNLLLSPEELTFCCRRCGYGCNGGYPTRAWIYFKRYGVVTGGDYDTNEGCQPYRVKPCGGNNTCSDKTEKNHECSNKCYGDKTVDYKSDHKYTKNGYMLDYEDIQMDLMKYGSVEASFEVYEDFLFYKKGVYYKTPNASYLGGHSVKCIGWGIENGVPYWLMVNSWNTSWGDNGFFKIRRGSNECKVDDSFSAGMANA